ncbi:FAD binding domain-containing protein [Acidithiobacillus sp. M4-SHS-6]|uniref:FAD binding domain-containing protein n=1 Tax=Acidithiobacillus sp. M4-SHS-6 TaxID=3383024 RepID=UPI0039BDA885
MVEWVRPHQVGEAINLLTKMPVGSYQIISGGTDVMVAQRLNAQQNNRDWLDLSAIQDLKVIEIHDKGIRIGAGVNLSALRRHPSVQKFWPMLAASAAVTGAAPIQNRATLGGNLCNASPAADNAPVLLAYGASLEIAGPQGSRIMDYASFHVAYRKTALAAGELLVAVHIPFPPGKTISFYRKVGTRAAQAIAKVGVAACFQIAMDKTIAQARFGIASVAAIPCTLPRVSQYLQGKMIAQIDESVIREKVIRDIAPVDDIRSSAEYRLEITSRLVWDALQHIE